MKTLQCYCTKRKKGGHKIKTYKNAIHKNKNKTKSCGLFFVPLFYLF